MSAKRSIMPGGTRLAALIALAITACLFAWRANTLLTDGAPATDAQTFQQRQLTSLLEPLFGTGNVRVASHTGSDGNRQFLVMINSEAQGIPVDRPVFERVVTILESSAGYDRAADSLHVQPFAFAPGTAGGFRTIELYELGALGLIGLLLAFLMLMPPGRQDKAAPATAAAPRKSDQPEIQPASQVMRSAPQPGTPANEDEFALARNAAARDPKAAARLVRQWLSKDDEARS